MNSLDQVELIVSFPRFLARARVKTGSSMCVFGTDDVVVEPVDSLPLVFCRFELC